MVLDLKSEQGKQAFLRDQGIEHIFNSRTLDFAEQLVGLARHGRGEQRPDVPLADVAGNRQTRAMPKPASAAYKKGFISQPAALRRRDAPL